MSVNAVCVCVCVCHLSVCHLSSDVTFTHRYFLPTLPATLLTQLHWANEQKTLIKWYRHTHTHTYVSSMHINLPVNATFASLI